MLICKFCNKNYSNERRKGHRIDRCNSCITKMRRARTKLAAVDFLGGKCNNCSTDDPWVMHFHHLENKSFNIAQVSHKKWEYVLNELKKCILLCANCHLKEHTTKNDPIFIEAIKTYKGRNFPG